MWLSDSSCYGVFVRKPLRPIRTPPSSSPGQVEGAGGGRRGAVTSRTNPRLRNLPSFRGGPEVTPPRGTPPPPPPPPARARAGFLRPELPWGGTSSPAVRRPRPRLQARRRLGAARLRSLQPDGGGTWETCPETWNADKIPVMRLLCVCGDESCRTKTVKQEDRRCLGAS
ncbi:wiskott-Aldrich syndrome protein homolog [Canis lupus dingo]|uniref:wiskott-Aldrich syndrome protein homolog n=1 Tax=Canis lupus dingo TaxID=286419 RepID=UPI000DC6CF25|nr:wiskott-Aldrich syndrome protein homolog [Canis lupus dingo]